jgi:flagellar operon protein
MAIDFNKIGSVLPQTQTAGIQTGISRESTSVTGSLNFSRHLAERIERRRLDLSTDAIGRLSQAVDKVAGKGGRDSVVFLDQLALLVNVPTRTVVTAIDTNKMKEGVFTNIDSVVVG